MSISKYHRSNIFVILFSLLLLFGISLYAQQMPPSFEESKAEPVQYIGEQQTDPRYHHGGLRHAGGMG